METKRITIHLDVITDKDDELIKRGIKKGVHVYFDSPNYYIAQPKNITFKEIEIEEVEKTKVKFIANENFNPDLVYITAFFPEEYYNIPLYGKDMLTCYEHLGQHGSCHIDYANESREATKEEYTPLMEELISIGYELEILNNEN